MATDKFRKIMSFGQHREGSTATTAPCQVHKVYRDIKDTTYSIEKQCGELSIVMVNSTKRILYKFLLYLVYNN